MKKKIACISLLTAIIGTVDWLYSIGKYGFGDLFSELNFFVTVLIILVGTEVKSYLNKMGFICGIVLSIGVVAYIFCFRNEGALFCVSHLLEYIGLSICLLMVINEFKQKNIFPKPVLLFVLVFLFFCLISRNEAKWPLDLLLFIWAAFLKIKNEKSVKIILGGLSAGVILLFVILQGAAFVFRPFDSLRYKGIFYNSNVAGMFYLTVYICFLYFLILSVKAKIKKGITYCLLFGSTLMWPLVILTQCRSALAGFIVTTIPVFLLWCKHRKIKDIFIKVAVYIGLLTFSVVIVFTAVRYVPACFHHPVWFIDEYSEKKVISLDPIDSEKYANPWDSLAFIGFRLSLKGNEEAAQKEEQHYQNQNGLDYVIYDKNGEEKTRIHISQPLETKGEYVISYSDGIKPGSDCYHPYIYYEKYDTGLDKILRIRKYIFVYYGSKINVWGNRNSNKSVFFTPVDAFTHSHNNALWIGCCFGFIPFVMYIILGVGVPILSFVNIKRGRQLFWFPMLTYLAIDFAGVTEWFVHPTKLMWWLAFLCLIPFTISINDKNAE